MSKINWTIGILTVPPRAAKLKELLTLLEPQIDKANGNVQAIVLYNNFDKTLGELRQSIVDRADGEYISFIDDDDTVPTDFIETILPHLDGKVDYIGFKVNLTHDGNKMKPVYHSLKHTDWKEDDMGYYRDITHLNPIKTSIARQATFIGGAGEDVGWSNQLRGKVKKEYFINREMYNYRHSSTDTLANGPRAGDILRDEEKFNHEEIIQ